MLTKGTRARVSHGVTLGKGTTTHDSASRPPSSHNGQHPTRSPLQNALDVDVVHIALPIDTTATHTHLMATPSSSATSPSPALSFAVPTTVSDHSTEDPTERAERDEQRSKILKRTEFAKVSFSFCLSPSLSLCSLGGWASARGEAWVARGEDASHSPQLCGQQRARRSTALPVDERAPAIVSSRAGIDGLSRWRVDSASRWPCFVATNFGGRVTLGFPPHSPQRAMTRSLLGAFTQRPGYRASSLDVASLDRGFATRLRVSHVSAFRSRHICCELLDSPSLYSLSTDHACTSYDACARVVQGKAQCHKCPPAEPRGPSRALKNSNSFWDFFC